MSTSAAPPRAAPPAPAPAMAARRLKMPPMAAIDQLIFEVDEWWAESSDRQAERRRSLIADAVTWHLRESAQYRQLAELTGFEPAALQRGEGLESVPQFPTRLFKRTEIRSMPESDCRVFRSSGTSGSLSQVWRDDMTLQRLAGSLRPQGDIWKSLYGIDGLDDDGQMIHLGPARGDALGVWIGYVMTLIEMFTYTCSYLSDGKLRIGDAARDLRAAAREGGLVCVAGPPAFVMALLDHLCENRVQIDGGERIVVVTGGGWKRAETQRIPPEELRALAVKTLGLRDDGQVRDVFNQVELNTAFVECEHHRMHVPPWVEVIVRDADGLAPMPPDRPGLLSYLDPSAVSYPCFLLTEDIGRTRVDECPCGRQGVTVEVHRRLMASDHQGCALRLAEATRIAPSASAG